LHYIALVATFDLLRRRVYFRRSRRHNAGPMPRVLVITIDPTEAAFRLRLGILAPLLAADSYTFDYRARPKDFADRRKLLTTAGDYDAVIVQRKLLDPSHARLLRRRAKRVVFDLDDAVMTQRRDVSAWSRWLKRRRFRATAAAADHILAGNDYLADQFRELGRPVTVLPTVVDPDHYTVKQHAPTDRPTLVWIGSASTLPYLRQWMPHLEAAARRVPGLRLITIANDTVASDVLDVEHIPWTEAGEAAALARGEIGIAPTPDDRWTAGKSGFKIVQYMATGLPTIASPVGANGSIVRDGVTGLLPATPGDWSDAIVRLATDPAARAAMGAAARQVVLADYTVARARTVWRQVLSGENSTGRT
jgi:glycosyltransferase involved in cell wall biosynthesis